MNDFQDQPGGGFGSVDGYNDIAGSQAEEQRRMQEDEQNRQRAEQDAIDAANLQSATQDWSSPTNSAAANANNRQNSARQQKAQSRKQNPRKTAPTTTAPSNKISPGFAILGFVVAGIWGMGLLEGDGRWFSGLVVGVIGAHCAGYYYKALIGAALAGAGWWFLCLYEPPNRPSANSVNSTALATSSPTIADAPVSEPRPKVKADKPAPHTPEQEVAERFPYPAKPDLLLRPHQDLATDPQRMRDFQSMMFDYEKKTGKSFLTDHRSMQPVTRVRFDYFSRYGDGGLLEGLKEIPKLSDIQGVWTYSGPQLWELNLKATVDQYFLFRTTSPNGNVREDVFRSYSGDGLCYKTMNRPLSRDGSKHAGFNTPVQGGKVWREYARSVYHAKTDAELLALDPVNLAVTHTHTAIAEAEANHAKQLRMIDRQREASLPLVRAAWKFRTPNLPR